MVELLVRLSLCSLLVGAGLGHMASPDVWKVAAVGCVIALLHWRSPRFVGLLSVADAGCIAAALALSGYISGFGFLAAIPCVIAAARTGSSAVAMAPLAASSVLIADSLTSKNGLPSMSALLHGAAILAASLLLGSRRRVHAPPVAEQPMEQPMPAQPQPQLVEDGYLQLRETYRKLRDSYRDLERRSSRDRVIARLARYHGSAGGALLRGICDELQAITAADEVALYLVSPSDRVMTVKATSAHFPTELLADRIKCDSGTASVALLERSDEALAALGANCETFVNIPLIYDNRALGMVCLWSERPGLLEKAKKTGEAAAEHIARVIQVETVRHAEAERAAEYELLYGLASAMQGAASIESLATRVCDFVNTTLEVDQITISQIDAGVLAELAAKGPGLTLLDALSFADGSGLSGWLGIGAPDLHLPSVRDDQRCPADEALKRRIGSYAAIALRAGSEVVGVLAVATQFSGGIDSARFARLRLIGGELSRAIERMSGETTGGLMPPREFSAATANRSGCLVYLEPLRKAEMIATCGSDNFESALARLTQHLRAQLPSGGCLCRRDAGDFIAFLQCDEESARRWANEMAASAVLIPVDIAVTGGRTPLALRARVAAVASQNDEVSPRSAA